MLLSNYQNFQIVSGFSEGKGYKLFSNFLFLNLISYSLIKNIIYLICHCLNKKGISRSKRDEKVSCNTTSVIQYNTRFGLDLQLNNITKYNPHRR